MIRTSATRLQRSRRLASIILTLAGSACTPSTVGLKPHAPQQTATPKSAEALHSCEQHPNSEILATPEAAVNLYVAGLATNNFERALQAYAAHEHAARGDFTALVSWVHVFNAGAQNAPAEYPMFVEINELRAKAEIAQATKFFVYSLLTDRDPAGAQTVGSDTEIRAFVEAVNPARLATLKIVRIDQPRKSLAPEAQTLFKKQATLYGADEMTERVALYELSGQFFCSGFQLARYDKTWKIYQFASYYAGPLYRGWAAKTRTAEYETGIQ